jgi:hypothetical protein
MIIISTIEDMASSVIKLNNAEIRSFRLNENPEIFL